MPSPLRNFTTLAALGFSSGLPLMLTSDMMQAWMKDAGISNTKIGLLSLAWIPLAFKFVWAPLMDAYTPLPLGRRRGWLLITQIAMIFGIAVLACIGPTRSLLLFGLAALFITFASASQDIVGDAYRTDVTPPGERGMAASTWTIAYRIAMLATGSASLIFVGNGWITWKQAYLFCAALMAIGIAGTFLAPEPVIDRPPVSMLNMTFEALLEMLRRPNIAVMLLLIFCFTAPEAITRANTILFLKQYVTSQEIGFIRNGLGLLAMICGALVGAFVIIGLSLANMLRLCLVLQAISNLTFLGLAGGHFSHPHLAGVISLEFFCLGFVGTGFTALLMGECNPRYSAFQYALLSGIMGLTRVAAGAPGGWLADRVGWRDFFLISIALAAAPMLLLFWIRPREPSTPAIAEESLPAIALQPLVAPADNQ